RRPHHTLHCLNMLAVDEQGATRRGIPDLHRPISAGRGKTLAISRPGDTQYGSTMSLVEKERFSLNSSSTMLNDGPDLHRPIIIGHSEVPAIGRPGHASDRATRVLLSEQRVACRGIPDLHHSIGAPRSEILAS